MKYYRISNRGAFAIWRADAINEIGLPQVEEMEQQALDTGASNEYHRSEWYSYCVEAK